MGGGACWVRGGKSENERYGISYFNKNKYSVANESLTLWLARRKLETHGERTDNRKDYKPTHTTPTSSIAITPFFSSFYFTHILSILVPMTHFVVTLPTFSSIHVHDFSSSR